MENILAKLAENQQKELKLFIEASVKYYNDEPIMSDVEFDSLEEKLLNYQIPELTHFIKKRINIGNEMIEVNDTHEMISLKKIKYKSRASISEIKLFLNSAIRDKLILYQSPKLDGSALKIKWDFSSNEPKIKTILSRGGLDVTEHFKNMPSIIETKKFNVPLITGELLISKKIFEDFYSDEWENARNFVGKLLKQNSIEQSIINNLTFIPCTDGINKLLDIEINNIPVWRKLEIQDIYNIEDLIKYYKSDDFPFLCDGIVISYDVSKREIKDNYPLNMVAVKFQGSCARTKVIGFDWTQKKSGKLTPMVLVSPVPLDGITVSKANGYNYGNLIDSGIGIGSEIEIEKSGDIIPVVAKVITKSKNITLPECKYIKSGKHLIAENLEESIKYKFILGLKLLNINGIGDTLAEKIGSIVNYQILDIFNQKYKPEICEILGGGSNWQKFREIYNIKNIYLDNLINLLQFDNVGPTLSKKIANLILKKSSDASNISSDILNNVCRGEGFLRIKDSINYLKIHGIRILPPYEINSETISFEMTGNPPKMTKEEFVKIIKEKYPNSIHESLTKTTKYLVCDTLNSNTGKINKARKYNIKLITYSEVLMKGF